MIEKLARMRYPDRIDLEHETNPTLAAAKTQSALKKMGGSLRYSVLASHYHGVASPIGKPYSNLPVSIYQS
jgi:hypothetical protein